MLPLHQFLTGDNAGFESSLGNWLASVNCSVVRTTSQFHTGTASMQVTSTAAGNMNVANCGTGNPVKTQGLPCQPGDVIYSGMWTKAATAARGTKAGIAFHDINGAQLSTPLGASITNSTSAWTWVDTKQTAPANAAYCRADNAIVSTGAGGEVHYVDDCVLGYYSGPSFPAGDANLARLQGLSSVVNALINSSARPMWHLYKTATFTVPANSWADPSFATVAIDTDGVISSGAAVINTPGYYVVEGCVQVESGTTNTLFKISFLHTAGNSNPTTASGGTHRFGMRGGATGSAVASTDSALTSSDLVPIPCYPGDKIECMVYTNVSLTLDNNSNTAWGAGRFVCNFTGYLVRPV